MAVRSRLVSVAALAALAMPFLPGTAFAANATPPPAPNFASQACPPSQTPSAGFTDTTNDVFRDAINCIAAYGVTHGKTAATYDPGAVVLRDEMAVFLSNFLAATNKGRPPGSAPCQFVDIGNLSQSMQDAICAIGKAGISNGKTDSAHFDPGAPVLRSEMAAFIVRSFNYAMLTINAPAGADYFDDDNGSTLQTYINQLASVGVVQGMVQNGKRVYGPTLSLPRDEMAGFLARALELAIENGVAASKFPMSTGYNVAPATSQSAPRNTAVSFTASGIPSGAQVDLWLFSCANVNTTGANPVFAGSGTASQGTVNGVISSVNNQAFNQSKLIVNVGSSGSFTFKVSDSSAECVRPVVFNNADGDNALQIDSAGHPTETVGIGGTVNFFTSAPAGSVAQGSVTNPTASTFDQGGAGTYSYDSGDTYQLLNTASQTCTSTTYADFQARLSTGDQVTGTYAPGATSTYCLNDVAPAPPSTVSAATNSTDGGVTVTWNDSATGTVASYVVYRAAATPPPQSGSASYACPAYTPVPGSSPQTPPSSPWTAVGTATDGGSNVTYTLKDTNATSGGQPANQYCYLVSAVDQQGQTGTARAASQNSNGGVQAAPTPFGGGQVHFVNVSELSPTKFTAVYNRQILASSCDPSGLVDFAVTYTNPLSTGTQNATVSSVSCDNFGSYTTSGISPTTTYNLGEAVLTLSAAVPQGSTLTVKAQKGADNNTVCTDASQSNCQAVGDNIATSQPTDNNTRPQMAQLGLGYNAKTLYVLYNANVNASTVDSNDFSVSVTTPAGTTTANPLSAAPTASNNRVILGLTNAVPAGSTVTVSARVGSDGNTVCTDQTASNCEPAGDTAATVTPAFASVTSAAGSSQVTIVYNENINCSTVDLGDFDISAVTGSTTIVTTPKSIDACSGKTLTVSVNSGPYQKGQTVTVKSTVGSDGNTVFSATDQSQQPAGDTATSATL